MGRAAGSTTWPTAPDPTLDGYGGTGESRYQQNKHENPCDGWGKAVRRKVALWIDPLCQQITSIQVDDATTSAIVAHLRSGITTNHAIPMRFTREIRQVSDDLIAERISGVEAEARLTAIRERRQEHQKQTPAPAPEAASGQIERELSFWWATLEPSQHQWPLQIVRREEWIAAAMARSACDKPVSPGLFISFM